MRYDFNKIKHYQPKLLTETPKSFAVLIPLVLDHGDEPQILLMQRPMHFSAYAGDICLPGGCKEKEDIDLKETALREAYEEVGISNFALIGQLDDFHDRYQQLVRVYVASFSKEYMPDSASFVSEEAHRIIYLPISALQEFKLDEKLIRPTLRRPNYIYQQNDLIIWGLTAAILMHFKSVVID